MAKDTRGSEAKRLLRSSITVLGRDMNFTIERACERSGWSCHSFRKDLDIITAKCNELRAEMTDQLESTEMFQHRRRLQDEIAKIDYMEHPALDAQARVAAPFFRLWLFECLCSDTPPGLENGERLAEEYVTAWMAGWRPVAHDL